MSIVKIGKQNFVFYAKFTTMIKRLHAVPIGALLFMSLATNAQTSLTAGDIAITGINATDNTVNGASSNREFSFILLKDISSGTAISFTDFGWRSDAQAFQTANACGASTGSVTDGIVTWTSTSNMSYGTQVLIRCRYAPTTSIGSITAMQATYNSSVTPPLSYIQMSTLGESLIAYTGSFASPNLITGLKCTSGGWETALTNCAYDAISSVRPSALTGNSAFVIPMAQLTGDVRLKPTVTIPSNPAAALAIIANSANWDMGNVAYVLPPANLTTPLPITLISFTAIVIRGQSILNWNVGSETKMKRYVVERSSDSHEWQQIGEINAKNISGSSYQMADLSPRQINLYRLRMEDVDGIVTYSNVASTQLSVSQQSIRVYPTKFSDRLTIESEAEVDGVLASITDQLGRVVLKTLISGRSVNLDVANLSTGVYQLRVGNQVFRILK
jgi:hypothetical protein